MYFSLTCHAPLEVDGALVDYAPDRPPGALFRRNWDRGERFASPPPLPVVATIPPSQAGQLLELHTATLPLMSKRLVQLLHQAGVDNLDCYPAEVRDEASGVTLDTHVAFNVIGTLAAAALADPTDQARAPLLVRLAGSPTTILVHHTLKRAIEAAGITTLTFAAVEPNA